ncbi:MAG: hypothetical protein KAU50_05325 [Candidatus Marinimicrobia bacterium]|nr:hypothetical protein [Candidatus Neomarinimicrobiota bacterium]
MRLEVLTLLILVQGLVAQSNTLRAFWSSDTVLIGQPVILRLEVLLAEGFIPHFPDLTIEDEAVTYDGVQLAPTSAEYRFKFWQRGRMVMPCMPVRLIDDSGRETEISTDSLQIFVASALTGAETDIRRIKKMVPVILTDTRTRWLQLLGIVCLMGLIYLLWRRRVRHYSRGDAGGPQLKPEETALQAISELRAEVYDPARAEEFYLALSQLIRRYLEQRFLFRALEMTTSEIVGILPRKVEDRDTAARIGQLLAQADLAKFAGLRLHPHRWEEDITLARQVVISTGVAPLGTNT